MHAEVAIAAAQAGKAILIEKPLTRSVDEADRVVEAVRRCGGIVVYAENRRFSPALQRMHRAVTEGGLGRPLLLRVTEMGSGPSHGAWFWNAERAGGGALIDMGIHGLATTEWLMQDQVASVQAMEARLRWGIALVRASKTPCRPWLGSSAAGWRNLPAVGRMRAALELRFESVGSLGTTIADLGRGASGLSLVPDAAAASAPTERRPHQAVPQGLSFPLTDEWRQKGHLGESGISSIVSLVRRHRPARWRTAIGACSSPRPSDAPPVSDAKSPFRRPSVSRKGADRDGRRLSAVLGRLACQSNVSDGEGDLGEHFRVARDEACLDFYAMTDHAVLTADPCDRAYMGPLKGPASITDARTPDELGDVVALHRISDAAWRTLQDLVRRFYAPERFVTLLDMSGHARATGIGASII